MAEILCVDCKTEGVTTFRPLAKKGKSKIRCTTHERKFTQRSKDRAWELRLKATYNLSAEQYWAIYDYQGGACAICGWATGASKKLSVDHDHACCDGPKSCGKCVRGILCSNCNVYLGRTRDNPDAWMRGYKYLKRPPAQSVLNSLDAIETEVPQWQ